MLIEDLGPTFVKFGQILADRPDVIADRFRTELKQLQSHVEPIDDQTARHLIENELCKPIKHVFKSFNKTCLASASIGQVYEATLKNGEDVIIKIQRPHIEKNMPSTDGRQCAAPVEPSQRDAVDANPGRG